MALSPLVKVLWGTSFALQLVLCGILITFRHFRRLPLFTTYICLNVGQALFLYLTYRSFGQFSHAAYVVGWSTEAVTLLARLIASFEILHLVLIPYRGIWGLAWRVVAGTSLLVLIGVIAAYPGNVELAVECADRGCNLIFATALISCLTLIRYYSIYVETAYQDLLVGFCFYSCAKILLHTILFDLWYHQHLANTFFWQTFSLSSYLLVLLFWSVALLHPLPARREQQAILPTSVYRKMSPEINVQLQAINRQLMTFWKIEEPQP